MNIVECNSTISSYKSISALFCMLFVVTACASAGPSDPLHGIDKTMTLQSLAVKRMAYALDCVGLSVDTLEPTTRDKPITRSEGVNCRSEAESKFPWPAPIEYEELVSYCMHEHDIPTKDDDSEFQLSLELETSFINCMDEIQEYRPVKYGEKVY